MITIIPKRKRISGVLFAWCVCVCMDAMPIGWCCSSGNQFQSLLMDENGERSLQQQSLTVERKKRNFVTLKTTRAFCLRAIKKNVYPKTEAYWIKIPATNRMQTRRELNGIPDDDLERLQREKMCYNVQSQWIQCTHHKPAIVFIRWTLLPRFYNLSYNKLWWYHSTSRINDRRLTYSANGKIHLFI